MNAPLTFSDTVASLILQTEVLIKDTNLSKWKSRIAGSEAEQRRWVKMRAQQRIAQTLQPEIATPASVRKAIHPSHVLEHESAVWRDEWSHNQVDIPCIRDLLHSVVPRPPACQVDLTIHPTELRRSAMSMVGKAPGPDSWQADDLVTLPEEFWQALADIWNLVLQHSQIPTTWSDARVALLPKPDGSTRPLSVASVLWRIGARVLLRKLSPWIRSWTDASVMGGLPGTSANSVHSILSHAISKHSIFVSQDLARFFDSVSWEAMHEILTWLRCPDLVIQLLASFYRQGRRLFSFAGGVSDNWFSPGRSLLQGCPMSPMLAACFM